jgi:hypothetical protein
MSFLFHKKNLPAFCTAVGPNLPLGDMAVDRQPQPPAPTDLSPATLSGTALLFDG